MPEQTATSSSEPSVGERLAPSITPATEETGQSSPVSKGTADTEWEAYLDQAVEAIKEGNVGQFQTWGIEIIRSADIWIDLSLIALSLLLSATLLHRIRQGKMPTFQKLLDRVPSRKKLRPGRILMVLTTWLMVLISGIADFTCPLLRTYSLILTCFFFIKLPSKFIHWKSWMSLLSTALFAVITLHILGFLNDVTEILRGLAFDVGSVSINALGLTQGIIVFAILFWLAGLSSSLITKQLCKAQDLAPNVRVLLSKVIRIGLFILTILITMGVMGIKLTTLTVFGGALGLGLGFGLQKVVSNFVSGFILLLDKSIKPGDVIEIDQTYGWINSLNLRYVSVITRDNKEHLIPNEDLITHPVINWSFSSKLVRIRAPFGISYDSDLRLAMELATECARETARVVDSPAPRCNLIGFGDSSVDFELRFWIDDPHNGVGVVRSNVLLKVWDAFHENEIHFPFPQRDVNLRIADNEALTELIKAAGENKDNK